MNNENLEFLQECLKYLGFGDKLFVKQELKEYITQELNSFQLETEALFAKDKKLEATLYFRRSEHLEMYFFHKYEARLRNETDPNIYRVQTFYIQKGTGVTFKEAFNLLEGRAVNKNMTSLEGQKYNTWLQLNFAEKDPYNNYKVIQFHPQYAYDLERTLEKYPIREMADVELRASLLRSLRQGNQHFVTFVKRTKTERMAIEANPRSRTINIYPARLKEPEKQNDSDK